MALTPATIKPAKGSRQKTKRVGRGNASGRGTYSGRGGKGQTARSGGKKRTQIRGFKAYLQKIPKVRGFKSMYPRLETVTLAQLEKFGVEGQEITPVFLKEKGLIGNLQKGVKIVGSGEIKKKLIIRGCSISQKAAEMIKQTGGQVIFN